MILPTQFTALRDELLLLDDWEDKYRAIIDLGRALEPMSPALKTAATKVPGCSSQVWVYAQPHEHGGLHFTGDSDAHIVKGLVALLLSLIQNRTPDDILALDPRAELASLGLASHLSPTRTNGFAAMAERVRALARQAQQGAL